MESNNGEFVSILKREVFEVFSRTLSERSPYLIEEAHATRYENDVHWIKGYKSRVGYRQHIYDRKL